MIRALILISFIAFLALKSSVQTKIAVKDAATKWAAATYKKDYEYLTGHMHPGLLKVLGGREAFIHDSKRLDATNRIHFDYVRVEDPIQTISAGSRQFCVFNEFMGAGAGGQTGTGSIYLLAISEDNGIHWLFIPGGLLTDRALYNLFPEIKDKIVLPKTNFTSSGSMLPTQLLINQPNEVRSNCTSFCKHTEPVSRTFLVSNYIVLPPLYDSNAHLNYLNCFNRL